MRNFSFTTPNTFYSLSGRHFPSREGRDYWLWASLSTPIDYSRFLWVRVLPELAKAMEVRLGCVREHVLSLTDASIVSSGLSPSEQVVVENFVNFASSVSSYGGMDLVEVMKLRTPTMSAVYSNMNTGHGVVWVHRIVPEYSPGVFGSTL